MQVCRGSAPPLAAAPWAHPLYSPSLTFHSSRTWIALSSLLRGPTSLPGKVPLILQGPFFSKHPSQVHHFLPVTVMALVNISTMAPDRNISPSSLESRTVSLFYSCVCVCVCVCVCERVCVYNSFFQALDRFLIHVY